MGGAGAGRVFLVWVAPVRGGRGPVAASRRPVERRGGGRAAGPDLERKKGIRWMPWHQEAMKDVARCEKPRGAASRR